MRIIENMAAHWLKNLSRFLIGTIIQKNFNTAFDKGAAANFVKKKKKECSTSQLKRRGSGEDECKVAAAIMFCFKNVADGIRENTGILSLHCRHQRPCLVFPADSPLSLTWGLCASAQVLATGVSQMPKLLKWLVWYTLPFLKRKGLLEHLHKIWCEVWSCAAFHTCWKCSKCIHVLCNPANNSTSTLMLSYASTASSSWY